MSSQDSQHSAPPKMIASLMSPQQWEKHRAQLNQVVGQRTERAWDLCVQSVRIVDSRSAN
jgi:hypothetical protein